MTPHVIVIGAGAAGLMAAIAAREAGARGDAGRAHRRRRPQDPHQRRRPLQRAAVDRRARAVRQRLVARAGARRCSAPGRCASSGGSSSATLGIAAGARGRAAASSSRRRTAPATCATAWSRAPARRGVDAAVRHAASPTSAATAAWTGQHAGRRAHGATRVVIATGGLSVPSTGSDGFGLELARALGHVRAADLRRAHAADGRARPCTRRWPGVSLDVTHRGVARPANGRRSRGGFLFTHRGYSGPAVLDVSHVAVRSQSAGADARRRCGWRGRRWTPRPGRAYLAGARGQVDDGRGAPPAAAAGRRAGARGRRARRSHLRRSCGATSGPRSLRALTEYALPWTGDEGYRTAEVTGGGVALDEVHRGTLESRRAPGLLLLRRGARRVRPDRRPQLQLGVVHRADCRPGAAPRAVA